MSIIESIIAGESIPSDTFAPLGTDGKISIEHMPDPNTTITLGPEDYIGTGISGWVAKDFITVASAGGSIGVVNTISNNYGIGSLSIGTTANTGLASSVTAKQLVLGNSKITWIGISGPPALSTPSADGVFIGGLFDGLGAANTEPASGVYFRYGQGVNSGKLQAVCANAGSRTAVDLDTPYTVQAGVFFTSAIVIDADRTSAKFYLNGALVKTITTNIPSTSVLLHCGISFWRNGAGSGNATWYADFQYGVCKLVTAR